jgi:hypothetical protein
MIFTLAQVSSGASFASEIARTKTQDTGNLSGEAARAATRAERVLGLQTEPPGEVNAAKPQDYLPQDGWNSRFPPGGFWRNVPKILLFCSITIIAAIIIFNLKDNLWSYSRTKKLVFADDEKRSGASAVRRMEHAQIEADDLARSGSFAEAIHILLLRSVGEMRNRISSPIAESLTSRELLRNLELSPDEREVFKTIVGSVEVSHFGGYEPGEDEYRSCRRCFDALTELLRGRS